MRTLQTIRRAWPALLVCLAAVALASCRPEPVAPDDARILILDPPAGATLPSGDVTVRAFVEYFELLENSGQSDEPGRGHIIFYQDVTPPVVKGESALTAAGTFYVTTETTYVWKQVLPGSHVFWAQLVKNDNTPLEPPAAVRVPVTISSR